MENLLPSQDEETIPTPAVQVVILDGAAIVNMCQPGYSKTFSEYATEVLLPHVKNQLHHSSRVDVVWDEYLPDSLKAETRSKRGKGVRRRVEPSTAIPKNWQEFLRIDDNKVELFSFLATSVVAIDTEKQIISTHHRDVLCKQTRDVSGLAPCTHEEADTRMFVHLEDAVRQGFTKALIRTVDTDVVVLAVTAAQRLKTSLSELWVAFGVGKYFRYLPAHEIARKLGPERCIALPMFHAVTGCDTVSYFNGRGKMTAWNTWQAYDGVTPALCALASTPTHESAEELLGPLERFVVLLYDRTSTQEEVNQARKELFTQKGRHMEGIPPTRAALLEHIKRAAFQAGHVWGQSTLPSPDLPSPSEWGWKRSTTGTWETCWTALPQATQACRELLRCGCKKEKGCRGQCKCRRASLQCTDFCKCLGLCSDE